MNTDINTAKNFLTINELAKELQVSVATIRRLVADRRIPFFKVGKQLRFNLEKSIKSLEVKSIDQY